MDGDKDELEQLRRDILEGLKNAHAFDVENETGEVLNTSPCSTRRGNPIVGVRLAPATIAKLKALVAERGRGCTISDYIRSLIAKRLKETGNSK